MKTARQNAGSWYIGRFLEEPLPGMMLLQWFLVIYFTLKQVFRRKTNKKNKQTNIVQSGIIGESFLEAIQIAGEEVDFPLSCVVDTWQPTN